jgi:shikimate dehydrogenase
MKITGTTKIIGVFGYPVKHSLSPVFQNAAFEYLGLDYIYIPVEVSPENLGKAIEGIKALNFVGVNLTIPHKKAVIQYIDEIDEEARIIESVNTLVNKDGWLKGYSTDGYGFIRSLKEEKGIDISGKNVFILGAGGSAYAITGASIKEGVSKIYICNRTGEKAELLKNTLSKRLQFQNILVVPFEERNDKKYWKDIDLIVNTTSVGMKEGESSLIDEKNIVSVRLVYDLVYNRKTELIQLAEKNGIPHMDGILMLIYQGAVSFELWTGMKAPIEIMKRSIHATY